MRVVVRHRILFCASAVLFCFDSYASDSILPQLSRKQVYLKAGVGQMYGRHYLKYQDTYGMWAKSSPKSGLIPSVGIGYKSDDSFRADLNLSYSRERYKYADPENPWQMYQETRTFALMANGYYDFELKYPVLPYVVAGIGMAQNNAHALKISSPRGTHTYAQTAKKSWSVSWNIGAGLKFSLSNRLALDLGYRYINYGTIEMKPPSSLGWGKGKVTISGNQFMLSAYCKLF